MNEITDEIVDKVADSAIADVHEAYREMYNEPRVGGHNDNFIMEMENRFIEYLTDETGCEPEEAVEILNNCDKMQNEIALYTYTGRM